MNIFREVKDRVTAREVADRYGLRVRHRKAVCPFHNDHDPSMLVDKNFKCFACGEFGDSIKLAGKLLELRPYDAARRLADDFGIMIDDDDDYGDYIPKPRSPPKPDYREWVSKSFLTLRNIYHELLEWKKIYAPVCMEFDAHPLYIRAVTNLSRVEFLLDELIYRGRNESEDLYNEYAKEIENYGKQFNECK
ncbi:MAG: CHC2 zinc finger domain-containing protein [Clostridia bacterium]|nr:CHC2 zinc finger domain-containing protein [Clostridia bacterium]